VEYKKTSGLVDIPLKNLHIRYIPVVTPIEMWWHKMRLVGSPHMALLNTIERHGLDWHTLEHTVYWAEREHRYNIGFKDWTEEKIKAHIKRRWELVKSIKKKGFKKKLYGDKPVIVLDKPFWTTRFGLKEDWLKGPEIWDGAGRCMASLFLGKKTIKGYYAEDLYPGTGKKGKFEEKLKCVKGVWK